LQRALQSLCALILYLNVLRTLLVFGQLSELFGYPQQPVRPVTAVNRPVTVGNLRADPTTSFFSYSACTRLPPQGARTSRRARADGAGPAGELAISHQAPCRPSIGVGGGRRGGRQGGSWPLARRCHPPRECHRECGRQVQRVANKRVEAACGEDRRGRGGRQLPTRGGLASTVAARCSRPLMRMVPAAVTCFHGVDLVRGGGGATELYGLAEWLGGHGWRRWPQPALLRADGVAAEFRLLAGRGSNLLAPKGDEAGVRDTLEARRRT
jgi:hypothetical protein